MVEQAQKTFTYVARDTGGAKQSGQVRGIDQKDATRALREMGLFPVKLTANDGSTPQVATRKARVSGN